MKNIFLACKAILALALAANCVHGYADSRIVETPASDSRICYTGRTVAEDGNVSFDWTGTDCRIRFSGPYLAVRCSDTKANYFNVWIDKEFSDKADKVIRTSGQDTLIVIAENLGRGEHTAIIQKRTEGEQGTVTFHSFSTKGEIINIRATQGRFIEFIGDSNTCGFGVESNVATDPFTPETENCNLSYAAIASRYFNADFALIAHSGQGVARNYDGDMKDITMLERYDRAMDMDANHEWGQEDISRIPDIVVIFLGSNDFSTGKQPRMQVFVERYLELVGKVRRNYGEDIPILCIASRTDPLLHSYISEACARDGRLSLCTMHEKSYSNVSDLGASYHPNRIGQRKIASIVIPYISSITGWEMPVEPYL